MPAVISKFLTDAVDNYERRGNNVEVISKTLVSTALLAYVIKISYPHIKRKIISNKCNNTTIANGKCNNNNNSTHSNSNGYSKNGKSEDQLDKKTKTKETIKEVKLKLIAKKLNQPGLNLEFVMQLRKLVEIMIPTWLCKETGLLGVHTLCLISRTFLSIYVASMEGAIVKYIVRKDVRNFAWMLIKWFGIAIPATFINSMIRYLENKLALAFR